MASASANALPQIITDCTFPAVSGFLLLASTAFAPISPIPMPGPITPKPIANAEARSCAACVDIRYLSADSPLPQ